MLAALAVALAGAGCDDDDEGGSAVGGGVAPGAGGVLSWALPTEPVTLDPLFASSPSEQLVTRQIHEPLVAELAGPFEKTKRVQGLAISALPSSDATVWRLRLRSGVRFDDGMPFNAQAVLANVERWRSSAVAEQLLGDFLADAPRPDLVRFILPSPQAAFDRRLASPRLGIVSPQALRAADGGRLDTEQVAESGTGPFELRERSADELLLVRDTQWWGSDRGLGPGVDQLEFVVVPPAADRVAQLVDGRVQVAGDLGGTALSYVRRDPLLTVLDQPGPTGLGVERSVRGIAADTVAPPLNSAWRTDIAG